MNLNTDADSLVLHIVFSVLTAISTSPVFTDTSLRPTDTVSSLNSSCTPIPNNLAPTPPVLVLESYPTIPPSINTPANSKGFKLFSSLCDSLVCLII